MLFIHVGTDDNARCPFFRHNGSCGLNGYLLRGFSWCNDGCKIHDGDGSCPLVKESVHVSLTAEAKRHAQEQA